MDDSISSKIAQGKISVTEARLKRIIDGDNTINVRDWELIGMAEEILELRKKPPNHEIRHMTEALEKCLLYFKGKVSYSIPQLARFCAHALGKDDRE